MSIFKNIPASRTCEQVGIPIQLCMRGTWKELSVHDPLARRAADAVLDEINNNILHEYHHECQKLTFNHIIFAQEVIVSVGNDNSLACVSNTVAVMLQAEPNEARFDARVEILCDGSARIVDYPIRINMYGNTADCVNSQHVRNYCYCHCSKIPLQCLYNSLRNSWHLYIVAFLFCIFCFICRSSVALTVTRLRGVIGWLRSFLSPH